MPGLHGWKVPAGSSRARASLSHGPRGGRLVRFGLGIRRGPWREATVPARVTASPFCQGGEGFETMRAAAWTAHAGRAGAAAIGAEVWATGGGAERNGAEVRLIRGDASRVGGNAAAIRGKASPDGAIPARLGAAASADRGNAPVVGGEAQAEGGNPSRERLADLAAPTRRKSEAAFRPRGLLPPGFLLLTRVPGVAFGLVTD